MSKNQNFSYRFFSLKLCQKTSFFNIYERKQLFLDQKIEVLTRAKKGTFFKGVSPWIFFPKIELFLMGVFHRNHIRKHRFGYCGKKRMILRGKIEVFKWAKKWSISKEVSSWILSKNRTFFISVFDRNHIRKHRF